jgi:hypothetical protein
VTAADGYQQAIDTLLGVFQRTGSPAAKWAADYLVADPDKLRSGPCCDLHGRNCEPPAELCCQRCTEASHVTFPHPHADGSRCVMTVTSRADHPARLASGETT